MFINKITFKSRVIYETSKVKLTESQKDYIDKFEENAYTTDAKFLGEGVTSKAYYSPSQNFVIKRNKPNPYVKEKTRNEMGSLAHENKILLAIDDNVKTTQKAIGYVETENGGQFLLSTLVKGTPANRWTNPFTEKHIDRLLRNLYRLDKSKIIHCDLSRPNLLLNDNFDVNIIDYQWGEIFEPLYPERNYRLENSNFPTFEMPNNATMFETAALPGYLKSLNNEDAEDFLSNYLNTKAIYTDKKYQKMKNYFSKYPWIKDNCSEFELAKTKAYKYLDSNIRTAELLKMNLLNTHRRQYSCYDENKIEPRNLLRAIPLMLKAKQFADKLTRIQTSYESDKKYFNFMNRYGEYWQNKISTWYPQTIEWLFEVFTGVTEARGRILFPEKFDDFSGLDVAEIKNNTANHKKSFWESLFYYDEIEEAEKSLKQLFKKSYNSRNAYIENRDEVLNIAKEVFRKSV